MFPFLSLEAAMDKWKRLASSASTSAPTSTISATSTTRTSSTSTSQFKALKLDDRLRIPSWSGCSTNAPSSTDSDDVLALRAAVRAQVDSCLAHDLAGSTLNTYQQVLSSSVAAAESALHKSLLPLETDDDVMELFGFLRLRDGEGLHWSEVRSLRAALSKYHERLGAPSPFDDWSPRLRAFWRGLEKDCVHSGSGKEPVAFDELVDYLMQLTEAVDSPIAVRSAAMVVVGFFGDRRGAEVVQFLESDVLELSDLVVQLRVRCQKNDPVGLGHTCIIPSISTMGACSPPLILRK